MHIEKNIPVPAAKAKYPFASMSVGDSIFIHGESTGSNAYRAAKAYARYHKWKVAGRNVEGGLRIWRIE